MTSPPERLPSGVSIAASTGTAIFVSNGPMVHLDREISPDDLKAMLESGDEPVVVDVRTSSARRRDPRRIPTAIVASAEDVADRMRDIEPHREIVLYCT